jgi:hypothetical protein
LRLFWIKFSNLSNFNPLNIGCGVTAKDETDAKIIILQNFGDAVYSAIFSISILSSFEMINDKHVVPNMGDYSKRGIWFPLQ